MYVVKVWSDDNAPDATNPYPLVIVKYPKDIQEAKLLAIYYWKTNKYVGVAVYKEKDGSRVQAYGLIPE